MFCLQAMLAESTGRRNMEGREHTGLVVQGRRDGRKSHLSCLVSPGQFPMPAATTGLRLEQSGARGCGHGYSIFYQEASTAV